MDISKENTIKNRIEIQSEYGITLSPIIKDLIMKEVNDNLSTIILEKDKNQANFNLSVCDNVKSLYSKQEEQQTQTNILSKLLNCTIDEFDEIVESIDKTNNVLSEKVENVTNNQNRFDMTINKLNDMLLEQSTEINKKNIQILELSNMIAELSHSVNELSGIVKELNLKKETNNMCDCKMTQCKSKQFGSSTKINNSEKIITISPKTLEKTSEESTKLLQRIERANTQNISVELMFVTPKVVTCEILGTKGNIYIVTLNGVPTCTCLDFENTKSKCKHIIYVLHKVLEIDINKTSFTYTEIYNAITSKQLHKKIKIMKSNSIDSYF